MKKQHTLAVAGLAATVLGGAAFTGTALASSPSDPAPSQTVSTTKSHARAPLVAACNGGKVKNLRSKSTADPYSFAGTSNAMVSVPGAKITVDGPVKGTDTLLVTFSAESYYSGTGWMGLEVHKDGNPVQPFANNGSPFAFNSANKYVSASAQFCTKVGKGRHTIEPKVGTTGGSGESGWLDDYTLSIIRFE